jgi:dTDP-4-amino-4,6-dideoxygalactose transaminase
MNWRIPLTTIAMPDEDVEAVMQCLDSGWLTMGPRIADFEERFAQYIGASHAVAVSSGTSALRLAALSLGLGPGDEMIVPSMTFIASASAARFAGAEPVFCDIRGEGHLNLDPEDVERRITSRTRAVMAVHFAGYPAAVAELRALCDRHGLLLIEDVAQAVGARDPEGRMMGTVGDAGCFSFFSKKQLCVGEGGMIVTESEDVAKRARLLRSHAMTSVTWDRHRGHADSYDVLDIGFNFRMDEPRAALGASRLPRLDGDIAKRREVVRRYRDRLSRHPDLEIPWSDEEVELGSHFAFMVLLPDRERRDHLRETLREAGIQSTWYPAVHRFSDYSRRYPGLSLPRSEAAAERHCVLPLSSSMTAGQVDEVAGAVLDALPVPR